MKGHAGRRHRDLVERHRQRPEQRRDRHQHAAALGQEGAQGAGRRKAVAGTQIQPHRPRDHQQHSDELQRRGHLAQQRHRQQGGEDRGQGEQRNSQAEGRDAHRLQEGQVGADIEQHRDQSRHQVGGRDRRNPLPEQPEGKEGQRSRGEQEEERRSADLGRQHLAGQIQTRVGEGAKRGREQIRDREAHAGADRSRRLYSRAARPAAAATGGMEWS